MELNIQFSYINAVCIALRQYSLSWDRLGTLLHVWGHSSMSGDTVPCLGTRYLCVTLVCEVQLR